MKKKKKIIIFKRKLKEKAVCKEFLHTANNEKIVKQNIIIQILLLLLDSKSIVKKTIEFKM